MAGYTSPRTPRSKGRGLWSSYKGLIMESYPDTGSVGSYILPSPGSIILPSQSSRDSSRRMLKRALQFAIPEKFKQSFPHRSENPNQIVKSPRDDLKPIEQKSFYGSPKDQVSSPRILNYSDCSDEESPSKTPLPLSDTLKPIKKPLTSNLRQVDSKSRIIRRKKFGMNKGVQHAIRKPIKKALRLKAIKKRAEKENTKRNLRKKTMAKRLCKTSPNSEVLSPSTKVTKLEEKPTKTGKIQVAERDNVKYEIKNGMPVFILRRSPRKAVMSPVKCGNNLTRKTPVKLFNPSGETDYLQGSPIRKRLGPSLPSPVKFVPLECENDDDIIVTKTGEIIQELIESLDIEQNPVECVEYNHFSNEEDYETLAAETAIQMEKLNAEDDLMIMESSEICFAETSFDGSERYQKLKETLKSIVSEIPPPTDEEINEGKPTSKNESQEAVISTSENVEGPTPIKVFPIFEKGFSPRTDTKSPARKSHSEKMNGCLSQTVIDAGQSQVGVNHCKVCDFIYTVGVKDEERLHAEKHNFVTGVVKFPGWKTERIMREFEDGKIIGVFSEDDKRHWAKVKDVLTVVDNQLGISSDDTPVRDFSKAYMFVTDGCVAGFLLAEQINQNDSVSLATVKEGELPVMHKIRETMVKRVVVGISRIWVSEKFQRKKIATRMVDVMRGSFVSGKHLKASEFAFTHTTTSGSSFATKYLKQPNFITYTTLMDNNLKS